MTRVRLGDLVAVSGGGTPKRSEPTFYGGTIPWVTPKDMKVGTIADSSVRLTPLGVEHSPAKFVAPGSVLVVVRSGVLKHTLPVALTKVAVTVNQDMKALTSLGRVRPDYLARLVKSLEPRALTWVRATTADNFPIQNLLDVMVDLPSLEEQRRIAAILDEADAVRSKRQRGLSLLEELALANFHGMFGDLEGSRKVPLGEIADIQIGPFGSLLHKADYVEGGIPLINPMHIVDGQIQPDPKYSVSSKKRDALTNYLLKEGDVIMGRRGEMGRCAEVRAEHAGLVCGTGSLILRPRLDRVSSSFLRDALSQPSSKRVLESIASGVTMLNLNAKTLSKMPIIAPSIPAQNEYGRRLEQIAAMRTLLLRARADIDTLCASLHGRAFPERN